MNINYPREYKPAFEKFEKNIKIIDEKKIQAALFIPEGDKSIVWFTFYNNEPVCIHLNKNMEYLSTLFVSFDKDCCYNKGTIFYGTMMNNNVFCIQDCLLFIGNKPTNFTTILTNISTFLNKYTNNKPLFNKQIIFSVPLIIDDINKKIDYSVLKYKIKCIQFRCGLYGNNIYYNTHYSHFSENNKIIRSIEIKSDDKLPDIYYIADNNELLLIPDYKTSARINTLFNKNKYENNIDLLEESDDEGSGSGSGSGLEKPNSIIIPCYFNNKFRKWIPNIKIK